MCRHFAVLVCAALVLGAVPTRANLVITATFDSSIMNDPNAAAIENTIDDAIAVFESTYSTSITVPIYFQEGGGLGESNFEYYSVPYGSVYEGLVQNDANPAAIAGLQAIGGSCTRNQIIFDTCDNPVTGTNEVDIKSANARALGIDIPPGCIPTGSAGSMQCGGTSGTAYDGIISLQTSITYPPGSDNGSNYGLMSTVEHEMDEILGLGSSIPNTSESSGIVGFLNNNPAPEDLFRYSAPGTLAGPVSCPGSTGTAYFSYTGTTVLSYFNNFCNGGDFGDWESNPLPNGFAAQVQDAFASPGPQPLYGPNEMAAESAIGYALVAPEPGTWILLSLSLPAFGLARRRRQRPR